MKIKNATLAVVCLLGFYLAYFGVSQYVLSAVFDCSVSCSCKQVLAYEDIATMIGQGWKETTVPTETPIGWAVLPIQALGGCDATAQGLGTETVRLYDYTTLSLCNPLGSTGYVEAEALDNGTPTDLMTTRRICIKP